MIALSGRVQSAVFALRRQAVAGPEPSLVDLAFEERTQLIDQPARTSAAIGRLSAKIEGPVHRFRSVGYLNQLWINGLE